MKKGQLSVEHLVIVGLSLMVILPATYMLLHFAKTTSDFVNAEQMKSAGNVISYYGRDVYLKGPGNVVTITVLLPENVKNVSVAGGNELVLYYRTLKGPNEAVFFLDFPVGGPSHTGNEVAINRNGLVDILLNSTNRGVVISEK